MAVPHKFKEHCVSTIRKHFLKRKKIPEKNGIEKKKSDKQYVEEKNSEHLPELDKNWKSFPIIGIPCWNQRMCFRKDREE